MMHSEIADMLIELSGDAPEIPVPAEVLRGYFKDLSNKEWASAVSLGIAEGYFILSEAGFVSCG